jgi:hypothetical protein
VPAGPSCVPAGPSCVRRGLLTRPSPFRAEGWRGPASSVGRRRVWDARLSRADVRRSIASSVPASPSRMLV